MISLSDRGKVKVLRETRVRTESADTHVIISLLTKYTGYLFRVQPIRSSRTSWEFLVFWVKVDSLGSLLSWLRSTQIYDNRAPLTKSCWLPERALRSCACLPNQPWHTWNKRVFFPLVALRIVIGLGVGGSMVLSFVSASIGRTPQYLSEAPLSQPNLQPRSSSWALPSVAWLYDGLACHA